MPPPVTLVAARAVADRSFDGFERWRQAQATEAQLLWRCPSNRQLPLRQLAERHVISIVIK